MPGLAASLWYQEKSKHRSRPFLYSMAHRLQETKSRQETRGAWLTAKGVVNMSTNWNENRIRRRKEVRLLPDEA